MWEKPAKYTRNAPRNIALTAATRRWLCVAVTAVVVFVVVPDVWRGVLMDMALPSEVDSADGKARRHRRRRPAVLNSARPPRVVLCSIVGPVSGLARGTCISRYSRRAFKN